MPLAKTSRIVLDKEIKQTYLTRYKSRNSLFQTYIRVTETNTFKLLVVISKKVHKRANLRNRVRRRVNAVFENLNKNNRLPKNISTIIQIKNPALLLLTPEILREKLTDEVSKLYLLTLQKNQNLDKKPRVHGNYKQTNQIVSAPTVQKTNSRLGDIHI